MRFGLVLSALALNRWLFSLSHRMGEGWGEGACRFMGSKHAVPFGGTLSLALALLAGCQKPIAPAPEPPPPPAREQHLHLDHAQSNLSVIKLWVGAEELSTEVCLTTQQLATGMMFRTNLAETAGMLFPFTVPHRASFYMRNTTVPLSAAYIDPEGVILEIHDLMPLEEKSVEAESDQVQYVLEVNQGWFARHHLSTGVVVRTARGSLKQIFQGR